jgi:hypothetical protein
LRAMRPRWRALAACAMVRAMAETFSRLSHEVLFAEEEPRCDVCGAPLGADDDELGTGPALSGHGLYVWARGDKVVYEEPPLCASCGMAIGVSALARWEIEEEEG